MPPIPNMFPNGADWARLDVELLATPEQRAAYQAKLLHLIAALVTHGGGNGFISRRQLEAQGQPRLSIVEMCDSGDVVVFIRGPESGAAALEVGKLLGETPNPVFNLTTDAPDPGAN